MPPALKGYWQVTAGIMPDRPMHQLTRTWTYTSVDYDEDVKSGETALFDKARDGATDYVKSLQDPRTCNWVKLEWLWV